MERATAGSAPGSPAGRTALCGAPTAAPAACPARGTSPYLPRRPQASPNYRVLAGHFAALERVHEERFESTHGPLRAAARRVAARVLDCGLIEHGFARVSCGTCRAEFLVAFRCKGRQFYEGQARMSLKGRTDLIVGSLWSTAAGPTGTYQRAYDEARAAFGKVLADLRTVHARADLRRSPGEAGRAVHAGPHAGVGGRPLVASFAFPGPESAHRARGTPARGHLARPGLPYSIRRHSHSAGPVRNRASHQALLHTCTT
jgi:hypothetical protein